MLHSSTSSRNLHSKLIVSRPGSSYSSSIKAIDSFILRTALFGQKGALLGNQLDTTRVRNQCRASLVPVFTRACNVLQPAHYGSYVNFIRFVLEHVPVRSCETPAPFLTFEKLSFDFRLKTLQERRKRRKAVEEGTFCSTHRARKTVVPLFVHIYDIQRNFMPRWFPLPLFFFFFFGAD